MLHKRQASSKLNNRGFTLVELMISISVLATILLLVTIGIIQISKTYYKGITQANTQQKARQIMDTVTQSIQFGNFNTFGGDTNTLGGFDAQSYCIDQQRFTYITTAVQKREALPSSTTTTPPTARHGLWQDVLTSGVCSDNPVDMSLVVPSVGGRELLGDKMRITKFAIEQKDTGPIICKDDLYCVSVTVMYGDEDLIDKTAVTIDKWKCQPTAGVFAASFCAKAELTSVVGKRLKGN